MNLMIKYDIEVAPNEQEIAEMFRNNEIMRINDCVQPPPGWSIIRNFTIAHKLRPVRDIDGRFVETSHKKIVHNPNKLKVYTHASN